MPQDAWSPKRERQYEHIKGSLKERGTGEEKAEEIAARTVNKERAAQVKPRKRAAPRSWTYLPSAEAGSAPTRARRAAPTISSATRLARSASPAAQKCPRLSSNAPSIAKPNQPQHLKVKDRAK